MGFYLSPMVDVQEIDLTTTIPAAATSITATVLRNTYKGPEKKRVLVDNERQLVDYFGEPTNNACSYQDFFAASGYLKYGNKLWCTRVLPASATFAGTKITSAGESETFTNPYTFDDLVSDDPDYFADDVVVNDDNAMWIIASSRGSWGNNIKVGIIDHATQTTMLTGGYSTWESYDYFSEIDSRLADTNDMLMVVLNKPQNKDAYEVAEVFNVSVDETSVDDEGYPRFIENVVNNGSSYIRVSLNSSYKDTDWTISTEDLISLTGGDDYDTEDITSGELIDAIDLYENPEEIDIRLLIDSNKPYTFKNHIVSIAETRKDCMAILDTLKDLTVNNKGNETSDLRDYRRGVGEYISDHINFNTSYACTYSGWLEVYDKYNKKHRWIPSSGHMAGLFARTDDMRDPWWAPAGLNRAGITEVRKLSWNPRKGNRDILYMNNINPLVAFAGQGKVVWGQKTLLDKESAFNRINVRRLFITLEKAISTSAKYFLFEPNDRFTRNQLVDSIEPYLDDVQARRGIYDYKVVCDESNNTPERMDRHELWCDIYIKPTRAVEFIVLRFVATKTGASFDEISL